MKFFRFFVLLSTLLLTPFLRADEYYLKLVASNLGVPWGMAFLNENTLMFTERQGRVGAIDLQSRQVRYLSGVPEVMAAGQGGLLDIAKAPNSDNNSMYFTYSKPVSNEAATTLAKAVVGNNQLLNWQDLIITDSLSDSDVHYGSRIAFDDQNHLYFSIGDRGDRQSAQERSVHNGSILRLNLDGSIPKDNPFIGQNGVLPEIWSYGHRNPQGLVWDNDNKRLWSIEHGPRGGDEINLIKKGKNYGWPTISYGKEYWAPISVGEGTHKQGMEQPIKVYTPSIAPGSLLYYSGDAFKQWRGDLLATALKLRHINHISLDKQGKAVSEKRLFEHLNERIRAIVEDHQGWIYFSTDSGKIYVIKTDK